MNKRVLMAMGIVLVIIGFAMIIISPSVGHIPGLTSGDIRTLSFGVPILGIVALIFGGIIFAIGFVMKDVGIVRQQQSEGILLIHAGQQHGPYPMHSIVEWYKSGKLNENDMVSIQGSNKWIPVTRFLGANNLTPTNSATFKDRKDDNLEGEAGYNAVEGDWATFSKDYSEPEEVASLKEKANIKD